MAIEKNPYDLNKSNVVPMNMEATEESSASFEVDNDGGVIVDFGSEEILSETEEGMGLGEWYDDLCGEIDEDELDHIANQVYNNYQSDKDSRGEWEDMFERGFDLLGLKLQDATEGIYDI